MSWDAYYRRNTHAVKHLNAAGFQASKESLAGGYEGVHVPLEGGYHLSVGQDIDGDRSWLARVEDSNRDPVKDMDHDIELGQRHPRDLPDAVRGALKGPVMRQIQEHQATRKLNPRQFG